MTEEKSVGARAQIRRKDRASYDAETVYAILDEALVAHVGFVVDGQVFVIPTTYARLGHSLIVHGGGATRLFKVLREGAPVCVTVTLLDGLVLARSAFHHSMNYRSVVVFGETRDVTDPEEKSRALAALVERMEPGRSSRARAPSARELGLTCVLAIEIQDASAKMRKGGPIDDEEDMAVDVWAGEIPLRTTRLEGIADVPAERGVIA